LEKKQEEEEGERKKKKRGLRPTPATCHYGSMSGPMAKGWEERYFAYLRTHDAE
jgi:hypothetical protein